MLLCDSNSCNASNTHKKTAKDTKLYNYIHLVPMTWENKSLSQCTSKTRGGMIAISN